MFLLENWKPQLVYILPDLASEVIKFVSLPVLLKSVVLQQRNN